MAKIKVWARVGISFSVNIDKIPDTGKMDTDVMDEVAREIEHLISTIKKLPHLDPDGESYIPENCVSYESTAGTVELENEETDLLT